jgi:hypothetical protein
MNDNRRSAAPDKRSQPTPAGHLSRRGCNSYRRAASAVMASVGLPPRNSRKCPTLGFAVLIDR